MLFMLHIFPSTWTQSIRTRTKSSTLFTKCSIFKNLNINKLNILKLICTPQLPSIVDNNVMPYGRGNLLFTGFSLFGVFFFSLSPIEQMTIVNTLSNTKLTEDGSRGEMQILCSLSIIWRQVTKMFRSRQGVSRLCRY